jgi:hypothetical protein
MEQAQANDVLSPFFATLGHHCTVIDKFDIFSIVLSVQTGIWLLSKRMISHQI